MNKNSPKTVDPQLIIVLHVYNLFHVFQVLLTETVMYEKNTEQRNNNKKKTTAIQKYQTARGKLNHA